MGAFTHFGNALTSFQTSLLEIVMRLILAAALIAPTALFANGGNNDTPTKPTVFCSGSKVYDDKLKKCVAPKESSLERDELYETVRYLAYAERYEDAREVLAAMPVEDSGRLTYMGFTARKLGKMAEAMDYYQQALALDPANNLARAYMGQGFVEDGDTKAALEQLQAIRAHGGSGTWPEEALRIAIATGRTHNY